MNSWVLNPTRRDVATEEGALRVWSWPGSALPIVFVHGFGGSGLDAEAWMHALPTPFHIIAPDLLGHGGSQISAGSSCDIGACAKGLERGLEALGVERFVLMGYSMGGRVALHWAQQSPSGLAALVTIGAHPGFRDVTERAERREWDFRMADKARELGSKAFMDFWETLPIFATRERIDEPWRTRMRARRCHGGAEGWARALEEAGTGSMLSLWSSLKDIQVPALILAGEEDSKYRVLAEEMSGTIPGAQVAWIEGAGHMAYAEAPHAFAEVLVPFLKSIH